MDNFEVIKEKLEAFIRKYHVNALLKGTILFFAIGVFYFLITLLVEHFLWLGTFGRAVLFWLFIVVELGLFIFLICKPLFRLFRLSKGIAYTDASKIIGNHFPEVRDVLLNALQLQSSDNNSELILASIDQKAKRLRSVPFRLAVNFKDNLKYLKYAAIPVLLYLVVSLLGENSWFDDSYSRVVNYSMAYEPPAPFRFSINNESLVSLEGEQYTLLVRTIGDVVPENASIILDEETYFLKKTGTGSFEYTFTLPKEAIDFRLTANGVTSVPYTLEVASVPTLLGFDMVLEYPKYTKKPKQILKSSGNATVPEGTKVGWKVNTRNTDEVTMRYSDTTVAFTNIEGVFQLEKRLYKRLDYGIATSNHNVSNYEVLSFSVGVVKDEYPELNVQSERDSLNPELYYFLGQVSDDYGISRLQLVYYNLDNPKKNEVLKLPISSSNFDEFSYTFPEGLDLEEGINYEFYFQVYDNDGIHNYKSVKSEVFKHRKFTAQEKADQQLQQQNNSIDGFTESLQKLKEQKTVLEALSTTQKEKKSLSFSEKRKLKEYVERQKQQEKLMKEFTKQLKNNLDKVKEEDDEFKEALKERLERQEKKLRENEKLLEELEILGQKLEKEQLTKKLDELKKQNKNTEKNLEQMVELTKRYYVIKKHEQLAEVLNELAKRQEELSKKDGEENTEEKQKKVTEEFQKFREEMEALRKENKGLKKPMDLDQKMEDEGAIEQEQKRAEENLSNGKQQQAKSQQKNAANKMKKMSNGMQMEMQSMGSDAQQEDRDMLRQALDNLVDFSLEQEALMKRFKNMSEKNPDYARSIRKQSVLREHFKHIDDTLYALALRTPKITELVTEKLTDIEFSMDKALELLSENQLRQGAANQQYSVTNSNDLAFMLSRALDNMNNSMQASGSGKGEKGKGFQLPDIIKKQGELTEEMKKGMGKGGEEGKDKGEEKGNGQEGKSPGEDPGQSSGNKPGDKGGQSSGEGSEGNSGSQGQSGTEGESGKYGGKNGKGKGSKGGKSGNKNGRDGEGKSEEGYGDSELLNGKLYEIFKEQQQLRQALEDRLVKEGLGPNGNQLVRQMKQVEQELLSKGFNQATMQRMQNLKHQLLKMERAAMEQGEEHKRESRSTKKEYQNNNRKQLPDAKQYFNTTEILNRQVLPLRNSYKKKVQEYFKKKDD